MQPKLDTLRIRLIENERLFKWFLWIFVILSMLLVIDRLFLNQVNQKVTGIAIPSSFSSLVFFFLCYLNYRIKIGNHDLLVELYEKSPPPPKITVIKLIIDNASFKPFKIKV